MWSPVLNNIISIASILFYLHVYGRYTAGQSPDIWGDGWGTFISSRTMFLGVMITLGIAAQAIILYMTARPRPPT